MQKSRLQEQLQMRWTVQKTFWGLIQDPSADPLGPAVRHATPSGLVIDAKSLYDSVKKE